MRFSVNSLILHGILSQWAMESQGESEEIPLFFKKLSPGDFLRFHHLLPLHLFPQNLKQLVGGIFCQDGVELAAIILDKAHILYDNVIYFTDAVLQDHFVENRDFL